MSKKLFLLDALALIYRAYYALIRTPRITSTGINTNAQFGFTNTLIDLITNQNNLLQAKLTYLNSQFEYVFRMKLLEFYKGQGLKM